MEAFNFTVANEDCNLYTYDMRKLQSAACMHKVSILACMFGCLACPVPLPLHHPQRHQSGRPVGLRAQRYTPMISA